MRHLKALPILVLGLCLAACFEVPTAPNNQPSSPAFDGANPPADSTGRGVFAGGGH